MSLLCVRVVAFAFFRTLVSMTYQALDVEIDDDTVAGWSNSIVEHLVEHHSVKLLMCVAE